MCLIKDTKRKLSEGKFSLDSSFINEPNFHCVNQKTGISSGKHCLYLDSAVEHITVSTKISTNSAEFSLESTQD